MQDICSPRHGGNTQSITANTANSRIRSEQRAEVLRLIEEQPRTMKEVAHLLAVPFNCVSGRGSELKAMGLIEKTGEVRDGSAVLRAIG